MPPVAGENIGSGTEADGSLSLWPIAEVEARGLFGVRDIHFALDEVATVLTGENGSGKSTLLKALHWAQQEMWLDFAYLPLDTLILTFHDGRQLSIEHTEDGLLVTSEGDPWTFDLETASQLDRRILEEIREAPQRFLAARERGRLQDRRLFRERVALSRGIAPEDIARLAAPEWLSELTSGFNTKLISARRLEHKLSPELSAGEGEAPLPVVEEYSRELRDLMRDALSTYAAESRKQEKNLPAQIVSAMQAPSPGPERVAGEVDELRAEVRNLADSLAGVGLFQEEEDPEQQFAEYPRDQEQILLAIREVYRVAAGRLQRLTGLRSDLELFADFLNDRFTDKRVVLNQENGIAIELENGQSIRPSQLSSGEEQLLALGYELLFGSEPHSIVLLDEPELSLHVAWLQGLLEAFVGIGRVRSLQFLIATHSPSVISGDDERERSLDYPRG
jgi:ABC-type transport system involved in cytochrome c biogenesis ATPase subunit